MGCLFAICKPTVGEVQWRIHSGVNGVARPLGSHGNNLRDPLELLVRPLGAAGETPWLHTKCLTKVSWNAMIAALAQHGCGVQAIGLFERMLKEDMLPDRVTFLIILSACSHAGLVKEGRHYSSSMRDSYGISPDEEHYARMIDLLCRCGEFTEAKDLIEPQTRTSDAGANAVADARESGGEVSGISGLPFSAKETVKEYEAKHQETVGDRAKLTMDGAWKASKETAEEIKDRAGIGQRSSS
ncbi:hypothetical protein ACFX2I_007669 [Malus domestica]